MLSPGQVRSFTELGYCRLEGAFPPRAASEMESAIWGDMDRRFGVRRDDPATWTISEPRGFQHLTGTGAFAAIAGRPLREALDELLERDWPEPREWAQPLVTFPGSGAWDVPRERWHLDFPARGAPGRTLGMKWLAYPCTVAAGGGGTLVIAGSHRLVARRVEQAPGESGRSAVVRAALCAAYPWFRELFHGEADGRVLRFMEELCDGVPVRVVELVGEPGDVVLFDPWLFHAPAPNSLSEPRIMLTGGVTLPADALRSGSVAR